MAKKGKILIIVFCLLLSGCRKPVQPSENRIVTKVYVQLKQAQTTMEWVLEEPRDMEVVLYYLRAVRSDAPANSDPERFGGRQYRMEVRYSDGSKRQIYQRADRFMSVDLGPWRSIDRRKAELLYPLLENVTGA